MNHCLSTEKRSRPKREKKNRSYLPQGVPWKAAETAARTDCPAGRVGGSSPFPPHPAQRHHDAEKKNNRLL
jgi:hypothetical protein